MPLIRVHAKGQITVPRAIREACGIATGTELWCVQTGEDTFECKVQPQTMDLHSYLASHTFPGTAPTDEEIDREVEEGILASASEIV